LCLAACAFSASAGNFSFSSSFNQDDNHALFLLTLAAPANVTLFTTSYYNNGGLPGFAPVLSIFGTNNIFPDPNDPALIGFNDGPEGGPCGIRLVNPHTGFCSDAVVDSLTGLNPIGTLAAGTYYVYLTEQENIPNSPDLAASFSEAGQGNFTGLPGNPGPFVDPNNSNITDSGNWGVQFNNVDNAVFVIPEPATMFPFLAGAGLIAAFRRRRS
jgi:hypothetical protein